ncbi:hypothetical protein Zmor_012407 [Zophobas morio]|uniref:Peptidase A2 domain-containing protein n=2 Tax=Zophobas morio TaxID=2755281 RepID=A0AA38LY53_9CUCU|nr:hypothetical protein Zmor_012407 [Zophobas morio]
MKSDVYAVKAILESRLLKQEEIKTEEQQLLKLAKENPFDLELQCKIEEQIRSENLRHNLYTAMEHIPESFSSVSMLYIKLEINGCVVKAFVDSGAQMSILSQECATRCSLMRLLDTRYQGVALGVGSAPIAGRIHAAHVKIGRAFLICSFLVLLEQSVDFILGLDMLKRHNCCIDLKSNHLRIGKCNAHFFSIIIITSNFQGPRGRVWPSSLSMSFLGITFSKKARAGPLLTMKTRYRR